MAIVPLTLTISLCLVFTFVIFFLCEHARGRLSSAERDSLLPLAEETSQLARVSRARARTPAPTQAHEDDDACGCRDGSRSPCVGCLKPHEHG